MKSTTQATASLRDFLGTYVAAESLTLAMSPAGASNTGRLVNGPVRPFRIMNGALGVLRFILTMAIASLMSSATQAETGAPYWTTLRQESQFKEIKPGDQVVFVCTSCQTISKIPIRSSEHGAKLGKDGASVACPTCHLITKVIVRASRKDLHAPPVVTFVNDKGEEVAFIATITDPK